jgi:hypothetical protein
MKQFKGKVSIAGKEYTCEVINGVRYIDGVTAYEFAKRLSTMEFIELSEVGSKALEAEIENRKFSPNFMYEEIRHSKN